MQALDRLLARRPDGLLYHYTTQRGLLGVIKNNEIWATDIRYLNDASEFRLACDLAIEVIDQRIAARPDKAHRTALAEMKEAAGTSGINVSVVSFSTKGDLLSQWRAYGEVSSGFSLGFEYDTLKSAADAERWIITPCIYRRAEQIELMNALVDDVLEKLIQETAEETAEARHIHGGDMAYYLHRYAGIFKDESFSEESEWRLISRPLNCTLPRYDYREGRSTIIPYYKFPLARDDAGNLLLKEVVVGPSPHPDLARRSVDSLLVKTRILKPPLAPVTGAKVRNSSIPYRNW